MEIRESGKRRLVVFGAGYVGGALARQALADGWHVTALTRNPTTAAELRAAGCAVVVADLADNTWWTAPELRGGADRVAVTVASGGGGAAGYQRSYVAGMESVVGWGNWLRAEAALGQAGLGQLIYTSSTSVYPQAAGERVAEQAAVGGGGETTQALLDAEGLAARWPGRGATVLRLAGIYGPERTHLVQQVRGGEVAGRPECHLNLIHRDDIIGGMAAVWENAERGGAGLGLFNLADDGAATKGEVVAWLAEQLGVKPPLFTGLPAGGRRTVTPNRIIDAGRAQALLGWRPRYANYRDGYAAVLNPFIQA